MAHPIQSDDLPAFTSPYHARLKSNTSLQPSFRLDEGYSEGTRSQAGSEMRGDSRMDDTADSEPSQVMLPAWVSNMTEGDRSEFTYLLLRSLRTSSVAAIVDRLYPLLHIDPIMHLPPEITAEIFSYLDAEALLRASCLSKAWRTRALDVRLWRRLFVNEGWAPDVDKVRAFEESQRKRKLTGKGKARARPAEDGAEVEKQSPKRRTKHRQMDAETREAHSLPSSDNISEGWVEQHGLIEADDDEVMEDVVRELPREATDSNVLAHASGSRPSLSRYDSQSPEENPLLILPSDSFIPKLDWQYLYKQKRRLEDNWIAGRYTNFVLPHPNHPHEAHTECVYTIQYTAKHLVSGSRDKTVRIWDLTEQRLMVPPLRGHDASVLCLQFDSRSEHDIVVSGGSDCHVLLWQFSTGRLIKKIERAHSEPVLNLRFSDDYLVTCSKDKTIKIWNRRPLLPTDDTYPILGRSDQAIFPSYIIDTRTMNGLESTKPLEEYKLMMTLHGHSAAVNAIQIYNDQIVSASGDRNIKIWNVRTGVCLKQFNGHMKGIACVQFDGRRIVSGSSDETVRIFDRVTGAEVACLRGHTNLVRAVQARFGDTDASILEDEAEARAVDADFLSARAHGRISNDLSRSQRRNRNAGSRDPRELCAIGAKLPPGGGGSKWARIVSGSYDETVIVWKRAADGRWVTAHQLYQWQAVLNAGAQPRYLPAAPGPGGRGPMPGGPAPTVTTVTAPNGAIQTVVHQQNTPIQTQIQMPSQQLPASLPNPTTANSSSATAGSIAGPSNNAQALPHHPGHVQPQVPNAQAATARFHARQMQRQQAAAQAQAQGHTTAQLPQVAGQVATNAPGGSAIGTQGPAPGVAQQRAMGPGAPPNAMMGFLGSNSRVFKLQFDSRRIICCSSDPTIVGWDFANGDEDIIGASEFFGEDW